MCRWKLETQMIFNYRLPIKKLCTTHGNNYSHYSSLHETNCSAILIISNFHILLVYGKLKVTGWYLVSTFTQFVIDGYFSYICHNQSVAYGHISDIANTMTCYKKKEKYTILEWMCVIWEGVLNLEDTCRKDQETKQWVRKHFWRNFVTNPHVKWERDGKKFVDGVKIRG